MTNLEKHLVEVMIEKDCSFATALNYIFITNSVDIESVFDIVDFLEEGLPDLDTVAYFMKIWSGEENDLELRLDSENEKQKKE